MEQNDGIILFDAEEDQPRFCIARAIVSLCFGIQSFECVLAALVFCIAGIVWGISFINNAQTFLLPYMARPFQIYTIVFGICAAVCGAVAIAQAGRFYAIYHQQSGLAKAGKFLGIVSLVLSLLGFVIVAVTYEMIGNLLFGM